MIASSHPIRTLVSWSSGKDSAWALHILRSNPAFEICGLVTTLNEAFDRVAMHAVRREVLQAQADAAGLPLWTVSLPWPCSNEDYESRMKGLCGRATGDGIEAIVFGDLFLEDVRAYREKQLAGTGLTPLFPLWGLDTRALAEDMIAGGLKAKLTCVDPRILPGEFAGREFDRSLLRELPDGVDPCGERGEFHSVAFAGPAFRESIELAPGEIVTRDGFVFADFYIAGTTFK